MQIHQTTFFRFPKSITRIMAVDVKLVLYLYFVISSLLSATNCYEKQSEIFLPHSKEHSLIKPYNVPSSWSIFGNAIIKNNEYVRLTSDHQGRSGGIFNKIPVKANHWEVHLHFHIHGKSDKFFGDGMVFWYTTEQLKPGPVFGASDYFSGVAVIIDTFNNHKNHQKQKLSYPIIAVMINNGSLSYNHDRDGLPNILGSCEEKVRQVKHETHLAIRYEDRKLHIKTDNQGDREWKHCVTLKNLYLPINGYFGVSASTGDLTDNHDVLSLKVYELDTESSQENRPSVPMISYEKITVEQEESARSIWSIFFIAFFVLLFCIFLSSYLYVYWHDRKDIQAKKKRMY